MRDIGGGLVVAVHGCGCCPRKIIVQYLSQHLVGIESGVSQSHVEAGNRTTVHFVVLTISAVHWNDSRFVAIVIGISGWSTQCLGPIRGESLDMLRVKAVAECMGHNIVVHHSLVPGGRKTAQSLIPACCFKYGTHALSLLAG